MNPYLVAAAILTVIVGLVHSVLGEVMIFRKMRQGGVVPTHGGAILRESNVRILWASWHLLTVFGLGNAAVLLWLAAPAAQGQSPAYLGQVIAIAMLAGSALVAVGTRLRHPGWIGLLGVAVLAWFGITSQGV